MNSEKTQLIQHHAEAIAALLYEDIATAKSFSSALGRRDQRPYNFPCLAQNWVYAKKTYGYQERDEAKRQAFLAQIAAIDPCNLPSALFSRLQ